MWSALFRKEHQIEQQLIRYADELMECRRHFALAMDLYLREGLCEDFRFQVEQTHRAETQADDLRYAVETTMYEKALLPESRGDILGLLENADEVPGVMDRVLRIIDTRGIRVPAFMAVDLREMIDVSLRSVDACVQQFRGLFNGHADERALMRQIEDDERHVDHLERRLMRSLFESESEPFVKLQNKDLLMELGEVSDRAHQVSRRMYILSVKRRV